MGILRVGICGKKEKKIKAKSPQIRISKKTFY
jgi:hypothetical protein